jgi:hypothetical protein
MLDGPMDAILDQLPAAGITRSTILNNAAADDG